MIGDIHMERRCEHSHVLRVYENQNTYANMNKFLLALMVFMIPNDPKSCELAALSADLKEAMTGKRITVGEIRKTRERIDHIVALYGGYDVIHSTHNGKLRTVKIINCLGK